jgi:hypothetical protein
MAFPEAAKVNKLLMRLIIKAAKGDKEGVYQTALEILKYFEESLEETKVEGKS